MRKLKCSPKFRKLAKGILGACALVLFCAFDSIPRIGEMVEISQYLHARSKADFRSTDPDVLYTLMKGTRGQIDQIKRFPSTGNYGLQIDLQSGPHKGEKVWVYFNTQSPALQLLDPKGAQTQKPEKAKLAVTREEVPAIPEVPPTANGSLYRSAVESGTNLEAQIAQVVNPPDNGCSGVQASPASAAPVQAPATCKEGLSHVGSLQIQTLEGSKGCMMSVVPAEHGTAYQQYTFSQRGMIQIFNSYDIPGASNSKSTGAATYYVFPRRQPPTSDETSSGSLEIVTSAGDHVKIQPGHAPTAAILLNRDPSSRTLVLDSGFHMGDALSSRAFLAPGHTSTFTDSQGNHCTLPNSSLFDYANWDVDLKFKTDQQLFDYLKQACRNLLLPSPANGA